MKKIMIMAALVASACMANAALVDWKVTGAAIDNDAAVYIVLGDTAASSFADLAAVKAAAVGGASQGTIAKKSGKYVLSNTLNNEAFTSAANNLYFVFVSSDEKQYAVTSPYAIDSGKIYTAGNPSPGTWTATVANVYKDFGGGDTPEPTSGLLLLLGVAGLALRRKQA